MSLRRIPLIKPAILVIPLLLLSTLFAQEKEDEVDIPPLDLTPTEIVQALQLAHAKTKDTCVACFMGGSAAAVVISEDGLVATAGHVIHLAKPDKDGVELATLTFADGTERKAKPLGCNLVNDMGLFQIVPNEGEDQLPEFPCAEFAKKPVELGDLCYLWSHPSGKKEGRPAQLRLGRITQIQKANGRPWMYYSDLMIQPGDSGGGVFSLTGELIAIASSAGSIPRLNRFMVIDRLDEDRERMLKGERFGDFDEGPGGKKWSQVSVPANRFPAVTALFQKRVQQQDRYVHEFIRKEAKAGKLEINQNTLAGVMVPEVFALATGDAVSDGLEDPRLLASLPFSDGGSKPNPLQIYSGKTPVSAVAIRVNGQLFISKASELTDEEGEPLKNLAVLIDGRKGVRITVEKVFEDHDLAILRFSNAEAAQQSNDDWIDLTPPPRPITQGSGLMAVDVFGQRTWGIACDEARPVLKRISKGPVDDFRISEKRAGFVSALSHCLPLYAKDAGTPVYDFEGRFVGIHIARHSRTLGLILPAEAIQRCIEELASETPGN